MTDLQESDFRSFTGHGAGALRAGTSLAAFHEFSSILTANLPAVIRKRRAALMRAGFFLVCGLLLATAETYLVSQMFGFTFGSPWHV